MKLKDKPKEVVVALAMILAGRTCEAWHKYQRKQSKKTSTELFDCIELQCNFVVDHQDQLVEFCLEQNQTLDGTQVRAE